jgi:DNA-binding MarR family transcriptional regulator
MMNDKIQLKEFRKKYYRVLIIMFQSGEIIKRKRLLGLRDVTENLIDEIEERGLIERTTPSDIGEIRYVITEKGKQVW